MPAHHRARSPTDLGDVDTPITSDKEKRYPQLYGDINTLDWGTPVGI